MEGKEKESKMAKFKERKKQEMIREKEDILMRTLSPLENSIMSLQSVLVWESQQQSITLFIVVHILFWLATTMRVYYLVGIIGVLVVLTDMWKNHIWPEIRVPVPAEDEEGWTPIHPHLLSVPEICQYAAPWWQSLEDFIIGTIQLRKNNRPKFFIMSMVALCSLCTFGCYIPGILLSYSAVLFVLLWPCFLYHDGLSKLKDILQPVIHSVEATLKVRRGKVRKGKKKHGQEICQQVEPPSDSDSDVEEFVPPSDTSQGSPLVLATLDSEEEEEAVGLLTPPGISSRTPSRDHSDIDDASVPGADEMSSFSLSQDLDLTSMPAYDDSLDGSSHVDDKSDLSSNNTLQLEHELQEAVADEALSLDEDALMEECQDVEVDHGRDVPDVHDINFVPSHFSDLHEASSQPEHTSSEVKSGVSTVAELQEEQLTEDLSFSDVDEEEADGNEKAAEPGNMIKGLSILTQHGQSLMSHGQSLISNISNLTPPQVSETVSSLMTGTVAGLTTLKDTVTGGGAISHTNDESVNQSPDVKQIEAEFEFLDQTDFDLETEEGDQ